MDEKKLEEKNTLLKNHSDIAVELKETEDKNFDENVKNETTLLYGVNERPRWPTALLFGFQQIIVCASGIISGPLIVADLLCAKNNALARVKLVGTTMVLCGIATFLQCTFGLRLPLMQGPSLTFIPPIMAMMSMPEYQCPSANDSDLDNVTSFDSLFESRMQIIQGSLMTAAAVEMFLGLTGLIGMITKYVGPLTIAPLMLCLAISVIKFSLEYTTKHWISVVFIVLLLFNALYLHLVKVPIPVYNKKDKCHFIYFNVFSVFPYLIAISIVWILCIILTVTNVFDHENHRAARTDLRTYVFSEAPWFRLPYPVQWGPMGFNAGVFLGMLAAVFASVIENIGDYYACARACNQPRPPAHAKNRGILIEGLSSFICGLIGNGLGVTTYSENISVIGITKVASRLTMQIAAFMFICFGVLTKFGAVLATIPDPIVGGILVVSFSTVGGVGLSTLQAVDLKLSRNLVILGFAIFMGILIPWTVEKTPVNTGIAQFDQLVNVLCSMQIFVAGIVGFVLDNTVPGATSSQRGLSEPSSDAEENITDSNDIFSFGPKTMNLLKKIPFLKYIPFLPLFIRNDDQVA